MNVHKKFKLRMCPRFFPKAYRKKVKSQLPFFKQTKNLKKPISGAFRSNIKTPKTDSKCSQKVQITNVPSVFSKSAQGKS